MMFRLAVLSLFCGTSSVVHSFVPQRLPAVTSLQSTTTTTTTTPVCSNSNQARFFSTATPQTDSVVAAASDDDDDSASEEQEQEQQTTTVTPTTELTPEYQQALDKAIATITAVVKDTKPELLKPVLHFCTEYITASQVAYLKYDDEDVKPEAALTRILEAVQFGYKYGMGENKFEFGVTHDALRGKDIELENGNKFDFYVWGCNFFRFFIDIPESKILGMDSLKKAMDQANNGENVVFFANHQSEADPQVMTALLEKVGFCEEASRIIYVAGHKVTTDALAIPFSMGRNLICIHSKKHIDTDPETKTSKSKQNLQAMGGMLKKLKAGGCLLWVAPSGGRDRRDVETGRTPIAPFDSKTIDMFRLMGRKSKIKTHYYPLAMVSYELCPPPDFIEAGVGEQRNFRFVPVGIKVGEEITAEEDFNPGTYEETVKDYYELRETIFPGTAPEP
jgi:glycerol-3-phosphate O-acyltransferase